MARAQGPSRAVVQASFLDPVQSPAPVPTEVVQGERAAGSRPRIRVGTASWTDLTLLRSGWYPPGATDATARLRHYASRFEVVEADAPYYAIPSPAVAAAWVSRTPPTFTFDVKAHALLTGHRTDPVRLPGAVRNLLPGDALRRTTVGPADVPPEAMSATRGAFNDFLAPLREARRLGTVLFQYPSRFVPGAQADATLDAIRRDFPDLPVAVEFRNAAWGAPKALREATARLRDLGMAFVAVDAPRGTRTAMPPVDAVTHPRVAILRLHGRNLAAWDARHESAATRFAYRYSDEELAREVLPRVVSLSGHASEVHVIFNNCQGDDGVRNAATLADLVASLPKLGAPSRAESGAASGIDGS